MAAIVLLPGLVSNVTTVVCDVLATGLILHSIWKSDNKDFRANFIMVGGAVLCWTIADIYRVYVIYVLHLNPCSFIVIPILCFAAALILLVSTIYYFIIRLHKWDTVQLIVDTLVFSIAFLWFLWVLMLDKTIEMLEVLFSLSIFSSAAIIINVVHLILLGIWFLSIRERRVPLALLVLIVSLFSFTFTNFLFYYNFSKGLFVPFSYIEACTCWRCLGLWSL